MNLSRNTRKELVSIRYAHLHLCLAACSCSRYEIVLSVAFYRSRIVGLDVSLESCRLPRHDRNGGLSVVTLDSSRFSGKPSFPPFRVANGLVNYAHVCDLGLQCQYGCFYGILR
ncbi:uncharacterized protein LAESUDRAFT_418087 [Laetiporus sulphureus 93-53]|uniref:Uncharacterized protein n=1 Tax=Laetiporus sulphureus 93-53 TaxID=1314785 RepID=A0A165GF20_9APHY|nr:uncharacterized protein LAESUDRAFT_418087 [Laetiporus sulphureus 93-53]KZT10263.1 hypothetical protein LAESUDRAFT_418087 [Laetiporus sulphureus 93-53]